MGWRARSRKCKMRIKIYIGRRWIKSNVYAGSSLLLADNFELICTWNCYLLAMNIFRRVWKVILGVLQGICLMVKVGYGRSLEGEKFVDKVVGSWRAFAFSVREGLEFCSCKWYRAY
jgi:hypothetical protein